MTGSCNAGAVRMARLGALLLLMATPTALAAQGEPGPAAGTILVGGALGLQPRAVTAFSERICGSGPELGAELSAGVPLRRWLAAGAFGRVHGEVPQEDCVNGLIPPPPDSGTVVRSDYSGVRGYPYVSLGARLTAFTGDATTGGFRLYVGGEWLPTKDIVAPVVGAGMGVPVRGTLLILEVERRLLRVSWATHTTEYRQRQPISTTTTQHSADRHRWVLRIGIEGVARRR
jgi:hypothetical protein